MKIIKYFPVGAFENDCNVEIKFTEKNQNAKLKEAFIWGSISWVYTFFWWYWDLNSECE
jgi:hypothetical protein